MTKQLKDYLKQYEFLSEKEIEAFLSQVTKLNLSKGEFFIKEGELSSHIAFINSGVFRTFYHTSEIEPVTYCFTFDNTLITAYSSWILEIPTNENIQALTDMELLLISKESVKALEESYQNWMKFFKQIAENEYVNLEKRIFLLQKESAEIRYRDLVENQPDYLQKIPLSHLASYLGVTQRHLSRIRKSLSI